MLCFTEETISGLHQAMYPFFMMLNPEWVHDFSMESFSQIEKHLSIPKINDQEKIKVGSIDWPSPIGLAAGLDKNAAAINFFSKLSFGAVEVGTVTLKPQSGNNYPRLMRLKSQKSLRNRMGFNNLGSNLILENIIKSNRHGKILGVNIGKNKDTTQEEAFEEYLKLYEMFSTVSDYLIINVSSPNTPGLRSLQSKSSLEALLSTLDQARINRPRDLYVKISPDLNLKDLESIIEVAISKKLTGIIATNTTIIPEYGAGGISGTLLKEKSKQVRKLCLDIAKDDLEIIGVGGVDSFEDLWDFWKMGGKVMQIYSSFIYQGPKILLQIKKEIEKMKIRNKILNTEDLIVYAQSSKERLH